MLKELKERKRLQALTMAMACGIVFTMGGQAYAATYATNAAPNAMGTIVGNGTGDVVVTDTASAGAVDATGKDVWGFQTTAETSEAPNKVELQSGSVNTVVGILATANVASKGNVIVSGGSSTGGIYGVYISTDASAITSTAADGTVSVTGGALTTGPYDKVCGIFNEMKTTDTTTSTSKNGKVIISSLDSASSVKYVYGIYAKHNAENGSVEINSDKFSLTTGGRVCGIYTSGYNNSTAQNGTVKLTAGTYGNVYGIYADNGCAASGGKVIASSCKITDGVFGIYSASGSGNNNVISNGKVVLNNVTGLESQTVYGIQVRGDNAAKGAEVILCDTDIGRLATSAVYNSAHTSTDAVTRLVGRGGHYKDSDCDLTGTKGITIQYGFEPAYTYKTSDAYANNTLEIYGSDIKIDNISNIFNDSTQTSLQKLNFYIQSGMTYGDTMLTLTGGALPLGGLEQLGVYVQGAPQVNGGNKTITLVNITSADAKHTITGYDTLVANNKIATVQQGATLNYTGTLNLADAAGEKLADDADNAKQLVLTIDNVETPSEGSNNSNNSNKIVNTNENGKSVVETSAAAAAVVNGGSDFLFSKAMGDAKAAADANTRSQDNGVAGFASTGANSMKYTTGSHVDVKGWNGALGLAKNVGIATIGVAYEHGQGNYDSYLDNGVHANGDMKTDGGTVFAQWQLADGFYTDAAFRGGRVRSSYASDAVAYNSSAAYYGFSLGGGRKLALTPRSSMDIYGRLFYTNTEGFSTIMSDGNALSTDAVKSLRSKVGFRYSYELTAGGSLYAGLGWQHEFKGDANGRISGVATPAPTLKGDSGMLELGWQGKAGKNLTVDLNLSTWTGKQKGISGGLGLQFEI